jgi:hypothetical protein
MLRSQALLPFEAHNDNREGARLCGGTVQSSVIPEGVFVLLSLRHQTALSLVLAKFWPRGTMCKVAVMAVSLSAPDSVFPCVAGLLPLPDCAFRLPDCMCLVRSCVV